MVLTAMCHTRFSAGAEEVRLQRRVNPDALEKEKGKAPPANRFSPGKDIWYQEVVWGY